MDRQLRIVDRGWIHVPARIREAEEALRDWWTKQDAQQFEPLPGVHVNGQLTMGENIADLGGLAVALDAYHASLHGAPAPVLDGLASDQRVFLGWAQAWRGKVTDDFVRKQVVTDPHSPRQFRVLGPTRNVDAWYDASGVKPDDKMYLPPWQRVRIWCGRGSRRAAASDLPRRASAIESLTGLVLREGKSGARRPVIGARGLRLFA